MTDAEWREDMEKIDAWLDKLGADEPSVYMHLDRLRAGTTEDCPWGIIYPVLLENLSTMVPMEKAKEIVQEWGVARGYISGAILW